MLIRLMRNRQDNCPKNNEKGIALEKYFYTIECESDKYV